MRSKSGMWMSAAAVLAAAGSALGSIAITPANVITWGGTGQGRSVPAPAGFGWVWSNSLPGGAVIASDGRVFFQGQYTSTPAVGTITAANHRAIFTATNSTDIAVFDGIYDGGTKNGYDLRNSASSTGGVSSTPPRISGNQVAFGLQISGGSPAAIETPTASANNTVFAIGDYAGGVGFAARQQDAITLNAIGGAATATTIATAFKSIGQQNSEINSSGVAVAWLSVPTQTGVFASGATGNNAFLGTKTVGGGYNVIVQGGQAAIGVPGATFQNGNNGVNGFFAKINRNGQVAFDGKLTNAFPVTTGSDEVAYIHTPGVGTTLVRREGQPAPDATGSPDSGGALYTGGIGTGKGFSTAGFLYTSNLTGGDVNTTPGSQNDSGMYLATASSGTTRVFRRNDPVPGLAPGFNFGTVGSTNFYLNNNGRVAFGITMQGAAVTQSAQYQWNVFGDQLITTAGIQGNAEAIITGPANALQVIARTGEPAPGFVGYYHKIVTNNGSIAMNNNGDVLFQSDTTSYTVGESIGVVGQTPAASVRPAGPTVLWGWSPAYGLVSMFYSGELIEVDAGVFKTISQMVVASADNGDGGTSGLNDDGTFVARLTFTDNSWALVKAQIPAPGTGAIAMLGLGAMVRRRRR